MKVPEKIYFNRESIESIPDDDPLFNYLPIKENDDDIEYVRKDAFIEKAKKWIEENICEYCEGENIIFTANNTQYIDILNQQQFIEDFKNYMEE